MTTDFLKKCFIDLAKYGKMKGYTRLVAYTQNPKIVELAEAVGGADELNVTVAPPPDATMNEFKQDGPADEEEAKETEPESEAQDGTDEGTTDIHRDDEEPGSKESNPWE